MNRSIFKRFGVLWGRGLLRGLLGLAGANLLCFLLFFVLYPAGAPFGRLAPEPAPPALEGVTARGGATPAGPVFFNAEASGSGHFTQTLFYDRTVRVLGGELGVDFKSRAIADQVAARLGPSFALVGVPALLCCMAALAAALGFVVVAARRQDGVGAGDLLVVLGVGAALLLVGTGLVEHMFEWLQGIGFAPGRLVDGGAPWLAAGAVLGGLGVAWWWRGTAFRPALAAGPARAARARGLSEFAVCLNHGAVCTLPAVRTPVLGLIGFLFMLSLILETLFEVPGLGQYAVESFHAGDVFALHSLVLIGMFLNAALVAVARIALPRFDAPRWQ